MRNSATTALKRPKLRMCMSKYNLYNLSRARSPSDRGKGLNFFKQKWLSKSVLRKYHGEQVREKHWQRMFSRRLESVVPLDAAYLASNDGSVESAGRGSGLKMELRTEDRSAMKKGRAIARTPYMLQTFAPLERRLDIAIFRALFASSARQARQFVIHGAVTVNGKVMKYPGYLLNPGDMFQVEPERVLFAMGQPKVAEAAKSDEDAEEEIGSVAEEQQKEEAYTEDRTPKQILKSLLAQSKTILADKKGHMSAKRKQDLRAFNKGVKSLMSKTGREEVDTNSVEKQLEVINEQLQLARETKETGIQQPKAASDATEPAVIKDVPEETDEFGRRDASTIRRALESMSINPVDDSKPYATPWAPRDFLPAFAFIPRYLEVNQNVCAAVYLRHPVARPGMSEVPSPFSEASNANAFAWYLRRR